MIDALQFALAYSDYAWLPGTLVATYLPYILSDKTDAPTEPHPAESWGCDFSDNL